MLIFTEYDRFKSFVSSSLVSIAFKSTIDTRKLNTTRCLRPIHSNQTFANYVEQRIEAALICLASQPFSQRRWLFVCCKIRRVFLRRVLKSLFLCSVMSYYFVIKWRRHTVLLQWEDRPLHVETASSFIIMSVLTLKCSRSRFAEIGSLVKLAWVASLRSLLSNQLSRFLFWPVQCLCLLVSRAVCICVRRWFYWRSIHSACRLSVRSKTALSTTSSTASCLLLYYRRSSSTYQSPTFMLN